MAKCACWSLCNRTDEAPASLFVVDPGVAALGTTRQSRYLPHALESILAAVAIAERREESPLNWRPILVGAASVLSLALFVLMRIRIAAPYPVFQGLCSRIRDANIGPVPLDWFCQPIPWSAHAATIAGLLLYALGFVIPGVVLAATGRRQTAVLPLLAAPAAVAGGAFVELSWWTEGTWPGRAVPAVAMSVIVMAIPVAAVVVSVRTGRKQPPIPLAVSALTWLILAFPLAAIGFVTANVLEHHWAPLGRAVTLGPTALQPGPIIAMVLFGALLGPDRRFWPWTLVLSAVLLSGAPSIVIAPAPWQMTDWSEFAGVVPLSMMGLVASGWRPLAVWLSEHVARLERPLPQVVGGSARRSSKIRPVVVVNAVAAALLIMSVIAFRADPLPEQLTIATPTFMGLRASAQELQARAVLRDAMTELDTHRSATGSFSGFHPTAGSSADAVWVRDFSMDEDYPQVMVDVAAGQRARVLALTSMGSVVCLERSGGSLKYGTEPGTLGTIARTVTAARGACTDHRWTPAALEPLSVHGMCDGLEPYAGYDVCRAVEVQVTDELGHRLAT